jgi:Ca2+-binding RTX toxin-like protein
MLRRMPVALFAGALMPALLSGAAGAADFSPSIEFSLSEYTVKANPEFAVDLSQDMGEEELDLVEITVPAGFTLATDEQLPNGTQIGGGDITIDVGPRCRGISPLSAPANVGVRIVEQDRTLGEIADGVVAIYVVDLRPVTQVTLKVKGSSAAGYTLTGNVPQNMDTCPPFTFSATFFKSAAGTPIVLNPKAAGSYTFKAHFVGLNGTVSDHQQTVKIGGPQTNSCKGKPVTILGSDGDDELTGTKRKDVVQGLGGDDVITTGAGNDRVCAGSGNDNVKAGGGDDLLLGQGGRDTLNGGPGNQDTCVGGAGKDRIKKCEVRKP